MAVVVTAPSSIEGRALLRGRARRGLEWLPPSAAAAYALALLAEGATRLTPASEWTGYGESAIGLVAVALSVAACVSTWVRRREDPGLLLAATLAIVLLGIRGIAPDLLVALDAATLADVTSAGLGLMGLGCLVWAATAARLTLHSVPLARTAAAELFQRVAEVTALVIFGAVLSGVVVRAVGASWACGGAFPECNGLGAMPIGSGPLADIQLYHRLLAYVALGLVAWLAVEAFRTQSPLVGRASLVLLGCTVLEGGVGAVSVWLSNPPLAQVLHLAVATAAWSAAVALVVVAHRTPAEAAQRGARELTKAVAYVQLTKPRVMSLLLATTAAAMIIAARGLPDVGVLLATLLGGALMSGGAGAINHYVDRDIDPLMGRTAWRPIPSGVISPRAALRFGIVLAVIASAVFIAFVNVLACTLALLGLLGYVFIYTLWLKRSTPSNIVIGGAAGAIPRLVGWAAVNGEISSLTAWYLFAIIFFWTPPHFWALSLLIREHYERAGVPMLPVVRGEDETRRQIVLYSVLLVVLTLVLSPFGLMGTTYFVAAIVLGGLFIRDALRLWRQATPLAARRLYLYSILYLFALFTAMAVDRVVT